MSIQKNFWNSGCQHGPSPRLSALGKSTLIGALGAQIRGSGEIIVKILWGKLILYCGIRNFDLDIKI